MKQPAEGVRRSVIREVSQVTEYCALECPLKVTVGAQAWSDGLIQARSIVTPTINTVAPVIPLAQLLRDTHKNGGWGG